MPRKPTKEKKIVAVLVGGNPVNVILHPPTKTRKSWYAYWTGLISSRSTGQADFDEAVKVVEGMLRNDGERPRISDQVLTEEELDRIQVAHFLDRRTDPGAKARGAKSLKVFREAVAAFKTIVGMEPISFNRPITQVTADECAAFQTKALTLPKNFQQQYPKSKKADEVARISANTVLKWSRALQAGWQRANRKAGKKCIRGVVDASKLFDGNPWNEFPWIQGREKPVRQFDPEELIGFLDYLESEWTGVTVAALLAKVYLWSACRQEEVTCLRWSQYCEIEGEHHFHIVGKRGVERMFRVPAALYQQLRAIQVGPVDKDSFVFASYNQQLRVFHERSSRPFNALKVGEEFKPLCLGDWLYDRLADWSASLPSGHAHPHTFRKTALQQAWVGDEKTDVQVAQDASVGSRVMMTHYVRVLREKSNRTFRRILAALPPQVARRYGYADQQPTLEQQVRQAVEAKDWEAAGRLSAELAEKMKPSGGCSEVRVDESRETGVRACTIGRGRHPMRNP
jgi:integrase